MRSPTPLILAGIFLLLAGCAQTCGAKNDTVQDAALAPSADASVTTVDASAADARVSISPRVPELRPAHPGEDAWVKTAARDKGYESVDLVKDADPAAALLVEWRVYPEHALKPLPDREDSPANHPRKFELVLTRGTVSKQLALGEHGGTPASTGLTFCRAIGYVPAAEARWTMPQLANVVSSFSMETMQSSDETFLLFGKGVLHVMHHRTEDGSCGERVPQGPLDVCPDAKWTVAYDVKIAGEPKVKEIVNEVDEAGGNPKPFDCEPQSGLLPGP